MTSLRYAFTFCVLAFCLQGLVPAPAAAEPTADRKAQARVRFEQGQRLYKVNEFRPALEEFKASYLLAGAPLLLFNMAQCHRQLGEYDEAFKMYRNYLRDAPTAPNRAEVEAKMEELRAAMDARRSPPQGLIGPVGDGATGKDPREDASPVAPAGGPPAPAPAGIPAQPPAAAPMSTMTTPLPPAPTNTLGAPLPPPPQTTLAVTPQGPGPEPAAPPPIYTRWWFWAAAGGAVVLALGVAAAAGAFTSRNEAACPAGRVCL